MGIRELKSKIENNKLIEDLIIFKLPEDKNKFLVNQYINKMCLINSKEPLYIETYEDLISYQDIFEVEEPNIKICSLDNFDCVDVRLRDVKNLILIIPKISIKSEPIFSDFIVNIPALEEWQIKDYLQSKLKGVKDSNLELFYNVYKKDIYKLENESSKISIFEPNIRNYILENLEITPGYDIFNIINSIVRKDIKSLNNYLKNISNIDPMSFLGLLYNNIRNIINIQLNPKATAQSLNMNPKQFNAIRYSTGFYNEKNLIDIFEIITSIDYKLKSGEMPANLIIDYLITNILSR